MSEQYFEVNLKYFKREHFSPEMHLRAFRDIAFSKGVPSLENKTLVTLLRQLE